MWRQFSCGQQLHTHNTYIYSMNFSTVPVTIGYNIKLSLLLRHKLCKKRYKNKKCVVRNVLIIRFRGSDPVLNLNHFFHFLFFIIITNALQCITPSKKILPRAEINNYLRDKWRRVFIIVVLLLFIAIDEILVEKIPIQMDNSREDS